LARRIEVEIIGDPRSIETAFGRAASATQRFQRGLDPVARGAKRVLLGMAALAGASAKLAYDFEKSSSRIAGLAGVGEGQVERWKEAMLDLAPIVGKAPQELSEALYFISSSGVAASDALDVLDKSARASAAGLGETKVVADAITSAMNAYGRENLSAAKATDILVATVREGKGEADAIAGSIGNVIPIAAQLGVEFEEVGAAVAAMTRIGVDADTAVTNLSGVMNALIKPAKDAQTALKGIGTSAEEVRDMLERRGLLATLQFLEERFKGNETAIGRVFRDIRGFRGVLALVGKSGEDSARVFGRMEDNVGALGHAFRSIDPDAQKVAQSMASLQASGVRLGRDILPVLADIGSGLADAAQFATEHETATKAVALATAGLATTIITANTALKIYNSQLVLSTIGQKNLLAGLRLLGPVGLAAAGGAGIGALIVAFADGRNAADLFAAATRGATAAVQGIVPAANAAEQADISLAAARNRSKLAALSVQDAERRLREVRRTGTPAEVRRAEYDLQAARIAQRQATLDLVGAERNATATKVTLAKKTGELREAVHMQRAALGQLTGASEKQAAAEGRSEATYNTSSRALTTLREKTARSADAFLDLAGEAAATAGKLANLNPGLARTAQRAADAAGAAASLVYQLGRLPTRKEIEIFIHTIHRTDRIEGVRLQPRQHGGPVEANQAYIVGERRPELFIPDESGYILPRVPSAAGSRAGAGRGDQIVIPITLELDGRTLWRGVRRAHVDYERRNGG
jgi:TP901 family phage tail tape measure protein